MVGGVQGDGLAVRLHGSPEVPRADRLAGLPDLMQKRRLPSGAARATAGVIVSGCDVSRRRGGDAGGDAGDGGVAGVGGGGGSSGGGSGGGDRALGMGAGLEM